MRTDQAEGPVGRRGFWRNRNLVMKFALLFAAAGLFVAAISFLALQRILLPSFSTIEHQVNAEQVARARNALGEFESGLLSSVMDYAVWNDAYEYARTPNAAFEAETLTPIAYGNVGVDYMGVIRFDGSVVWSKVADVPSGRFLADESAAITRQVVTGPFAAKARSQDRVGTILRGSRGLYAIQSGWIRKSDGSGQPDGLFMMGKLLNEHDLSNALQVKADIAIGGGGELARPILANAEKATSVMLPHGIRNSLGLLDSQGQLQGIVTFVTPRRIATVGSGALHSALVAMGISLAVMAALLALGIHRLTVVRLQSMREHVRDFRNERKPIDPALLESGDEIGSLARQFDWLAGELAEAEEELRKQSYVQGKADSAVGLLHNVRNALAPLRVMTDKWHREEGNPLRGQLRMALEELEANDVDPQRKAALESFARAAGARLIKLGETRAAEIGEIKESLDQLLEILSGHDFSSSAKPRMETVNLRGIILRELRNREITEGREIALELPGEIPPVRGNHIHLVQLIGNIIGNAVDSMRAAGVAEMRLTVDCRPDPSGDGVELSITDNGEGLAPEILAKVFERGISTRSSRSGGMGLHWSANAARAMDGSLTLHSDGPGRGATALLRLPRATVQAAAPVRELAA